MHYKNYKLVFVNICMLSYSAEGYIYDLMQTNEQPHAYPLGNTTCSDNNAWYRLFAGDGSRCVGIL